MPETLAALLARATRALTEAGIEDAALEARLLLGHATGLARDVLIDRTRLIDPAAFDSLLARRLAREPLAFITGQQGFWSLDLAVSPATLIPRPDSETLITAAQQFCDGAVARILDLGTGTGCLLLAALEVFPAATGIGVDLAPDAAFLAARNARDTGLAGRAAFLAGHWADALADRFDLVLANPPYIRHDEINGLMPEVARHEPARALDGGPDGLDAYRVILPRLAGLLTPNGTAIIEIGIGQSQDISTLAAAAGLVVRAILPDLGNVPRAVVLQVEKTFGSPGGSD
jgi:release factor glutamine methyltransferase